MKCYPAIGDDHGMETLPDLNFEVDYIRIPTVEEAKQFFGPISPEERAWRGKMYFNEMLQTPRSKLGLGEHDRAEAYIFGDGIFPERDKAAHQSHFPVSVKVIAINELFLSPFQVMDLTALAEEFPWDIGDSEIYLHLTIQRLILGCQSKLIVNGNVLILYCAEAVANDLNGGQAIIELGSSDAVQERSFFRPRPVSNVPAHGEDGSNGAALEGEATPLGLRIREGCDSYKGQDGGAGSKGTVGNKGRNGAMLFLSDLRFGKLTGFEKQSILLKAGAGAGFPGTDGCDGGNGGNGGRGTDGMATTFGLVRGYPGGRGGRGGDGGNGGRGGNGGQCCDVFVSVPPQHSIVFQSETSPAPGGIGGKGGKGGLGGTAGRYGKFQGDGEDLLAAKGENGSNGIAGAAGKTREAPKVHIYERYLIKNNP
ncbi:hypothetical protein [Mucilaginibacter sp. BT774]|uniref:hypothetical protein n=1 Tax=Mucilaginibacter sp. BT774 TaxID=3062276 RepID=UPI00267668B5|nr:hypothetical protein [Mucilaginibacter sp. BT774]MDO3628611.1 hypothetical protein [Mucilaginibacter sp. BT774]